MFLFMIWAFPQGALAADGADFANNLFTDLGPLLALFGERVAVQYLSHSTSWLECLLFACAPLGILTAVVSAIRVSGNRWLKAIVGRAREPAAVVELELMSSTSSDVCELWNGVGIVRVVGSPSIAQLIYQEPTSPGHLDSGNPNHQPIVDTLETAQQRGLVSSVSGPRQRTDRLGAPPPVISEPPPNIVLNVTGGTVRGWELAVSVVVGLIVQVAVLAFDGWLVYWPNTLLNKVPAADAYPLTALGTIGVTIGTFVCAHVIESSTEEEVWRLAANTGQPLRIVWIQRSKVVGDQAFGSFAIFDPRRRQEIRSSRKIQETTKAIQLKALGGTILTIGSFIVQFIGLRSMHWAASIAQLLATGFMVILRALVYRRISMMPRAEPLHDGYELDKLAMDIHGCDELEFDIDPKQEQDIPETRDSCLAERLLLTRIKLETLTGWPSMVKSLARQIANSMQRTLDDIYCRQNSGILIHDSFLDVSVFEWKLRVLTSKARSKHQNDILTFTLRRGKSDKQWTSWQADVSSINAIVSLFVYQFRLSMEDFASKPPYHPIGYTSSWILGPDDPLTRIAFDWWIRRPGVICGYRDDCSILNYKRLFPYSTYDLSGRGFGDRTSMSQLPGQTSVSVPLHEDHNGAVELCAHI
ncbi:hypothetical protein QBC40DRAFT_270428, partial [Triangularia verruculosa]